MKTFSGGCWRYTPLTSHVVFDRLYVLKYNCLFVCIQMMYDASGAGINLRRFTGASLAWWHSFKWCTKMILQVFANDFIAPMFHFMFPTREFSVKKQRHTPNMVYLSYINLAYPSFKEQLELALEDLTMAPRKRVLLTNLQSLCEYFIPAVSRNSFKFERSKIFILFFFGQYTVVCA